MKKNAAKRSASAGSYAAKRSMIVCLVGLFLCGFMMSCIGTTGGEIVTFAAEASGPADAHAGAPLEFQTDRGWHVVLTKATIHVGALYLDQSVPVSGAQTTGCILPGTYVGEVTSGADIDLLSSNATPFPARGEGTTLPALVGQVWLTQGDVSAIEPGAPVLVLAGTADQNGQSWPFTAQITIGQNRLGASGGLAGANPICKQRIVSPILTNLVLAQSGTLHLTIDPRLLFVNVDFSALAPSSSGVGYAFKDDASDQPSTALYSALRSTGQLYAFSWKP